MSVLLIALITLQLIGLALQVLWHYADSPAMVLASQTPEFRTKVQDEFTTRLHKINDHKVVDA